MELSSGAARNLFWRGICFVVDPITLDWPCVELLNVCFAVDTDLDMDTAVDPQRKDYIICLH